MDHLQTKNHNYQPQDEKKRKDVVLSTCTPIKHNNKTPFMENSKTKM
jgi:sortase (surface protein transpeptidase)